MRIPHRRREGVLLRRACAVLMVGGAVVSSLVSSGPQRQMSRGIVLPNSQEEVEVVVVSKRGRSLGMEDD